MQSEDQYLERTPDLVARIRKLRETAEKEMNRFTCLSDYDVRRFVGHGPRTAPVSASAADSRPKKSSGKPSTAQTSIRFSPAPAEPGDGGEAE
jgi:hypothetical protein